MALEAAFACSRDRARGDHEGRCAASSGDEERNDCGHGCSHVAAAGRAPLLLDSLPSLAIESRAGDRSGGDAAVMAAPAARLPHSPVAAAAALKAASATARALALVALTAGNVAVYLEYPPPPLSFGSCASGRVPAGDLGGSTR